MSDQPFEPTVIGFFCNWCSYRAADLAGMSRLKYPPSIRVIRVMCSGRVDPAFVMKALAGGADGVLIAGCHPGECHYLEQNHKTMRRVALIKHTLKALGLPPERLQLQWASASEGPQLAAAIEAFVQRLRAMGPLNWRGFWTDPIADDADLAELAHEHAEALEVSK